VTRDESTTTRSETDAHVLRDRWLRSVADLENLRKRTAREIENETLRARQSLIRDFLPVVDSLERALAQDAAAEDQNTWLLGMRAIYEQMVDTLHRQGVRPFDALGARFDPHRHDALSCVENDAVEEGTIVEVIKTGYAMSDGQLLRPAEVVVTCRRNDDR